MVRGEKKSILKISGISCSKRLKIDKERDKKKLLLKILFAYCIKLKCTRFYVCLCELPIQRTQKMCNKKLCLFNNTNIHKGKITRR